MPTCEFCGFADDCRTKFDKHFRLAACRQARSILFCCKLCDHVAHSFASIRKHDCSKLRFEYNEMQRLRSEVKQSKFIMTTCCEEEWYKMKNNLEIIRNGLKTNISLEDLTTKTTLQKCKEKNLPLNIVQALLHNKKWLREEAPGLPTLCIESIVKVKSNNMQERYFNFTMHRECDINHYFKLLFGKADASYWPFCLPNSKIVQHCFAPPSGHCPLARRDDAFFVLKTLNRLGRVLDESDHTDWKWASIDRDDLYRFIFMEWIHKHFKNIVSMLEKTPGLFSVNDDAQQLKKKMNTIHPFVLEFIVFWSNPDAVLQVICDVPFMEAGDLRVDCSQLEFDFEHVVKLSSSKKYSASWKLVMEILEERKEFESKFL